MNNCIEVKEYINIGNSHNKKKIIILDKLYPFNSQVIIINNYKNDIYDKFFFFTLTHFTRIMINLIKTIVKSNSILIIIAEKISTKLKKS